ncbi:hypothetical protein Cch01nite_07120 [Cellulomonas chitinilytica]|uniref:Uncharacterized protein n=1 Tax=Cellulomonas chitinilytica TaxID=398759 RepID=A0A919TYQ8_9CELL|nr:hypothetical protein [Cellulomonas chitinilytica]GIG19988.1 hypothetical protein Cch01nite_07120 [Cellulomonas chitinilytica]
MTGSRAGTRPTLLAPRGAAALALLDDDVLDRVRALLVAGRLHGLLLGAERLDGGVAASEPTGLAATLAGRLPEAGLVTVSADPHDHPYNTARRTLSLDHVTGARSGVLFGGHGATVGETAERVLVVRELWNSYPVQSIVGDRATGVFAVVDGVRDVAHRGPRYDVAGALNTPSSRQGEPVSFWSVDGPAGAPDDGLVDVLVVPATTHLSATAGARVYRRGPLDPSWPDGTPPWAADGLVLETGDLAPATLDALDRLPRQAATVTGTLRHRLGLPDRSINLTDRPRTFGATA